MKYEEVGYKSFRQDDKDGPELMANFTARIKQETRFVDGLTNKTLLLIEGMMPGETEQSEPVILPPVEVDSESFAGLNWVMPNWGIRAVIRPGAGIKDDLRTMIQLLSKPAVKTVYKQTGWLGIGGKMTYLHVGGGIDRMGNHPEITVRLPAELQRYDLTTQEPHYECINATLDLANLARPDLMWPLIAATIAPLYGACDFAVHVTGRTGSFKSELAALCLSHYGAGLDARHLPGSWSSTPNALEALAFFAANAVFVIDDFVPGGTSWQQRMLHANADKIIRAQGNQSGRARLTDTSQLQQTMYPRGLILSTGEDTPEGHSVRARMLILEITAGEIAANALTAAQSVRAKYCGTTAWLVQSLAAQPASLAARIEELRTKYRDIGHSRTPGMLARLIACCEDMLNRAAAQELLTANEAQSYKRIATAAIEKAGSIQQSFLEDSDPVDVFMAALRQSLASGGGHIRSLRGGVPSKADILGWTVERSAGEMATFKSRGATIGWCDWNKDELYIDITAGYNIIRKAAGNDLSLSKQTLFKRLKDAGALTRVDDGRQRNTIRVTAENHPRQVLCLSLSTALDVEDVSDEESAAATSDNEPADDGGSEEE